MSDFSYRLVKRPEMPFFFVEYTVPMYSEPTLVYNYWPVDVQRSRCSPEDVGLELVSHGTGSFTFKSTGSPDDWHQREKFVTLPDAGRTEAIKGMGREEPIPPPKQRGKPLETRYRDGRWWKYTKSKGWVIA